MKRKHEKWEAGVYGKKNKNRIPDNWDELRKYIIRKYNFTCLRCDKRFRGYAHLTVHHLIPRADDGGDNVENLVSLCPKCHDFVECENLRTRAEIIGSYGEPIEESPILPEGEVDRSRPDWHAWVYGGGRNPQCQK